MIVADELRCWQATQVTTAIQSSRQRRGQPAGRAIDGGVEIGTCIGGEYARRTVHADADATGLVIAATRPVLVSETRNHPSHMTLKGGERGFDAFRDVSTQRWGHREALGLNLNFHVLMPKLMLVSHAAIEMAFNPVE